MPKKNKKAIGKLPKRMLILPNADKAFHEKWYPGRDELNIPHPYRLICFGPPNSGKTMVLKNLILRADPPFERIYLIHCDVSYSREWDDINVEKLHEIPAPSDWEGDVKSLVIMDDVQVKELGKQEKKNLDRLFGFVSTHKNISVCLTAQDCFQVPPNVRRCCNFFILWQSHDLDSLATVSRKSGLKSEELNTIFSTLFKNKHESLWIDMTSGSPYPLRKNGYEIIEK